MMRWNAAFAMPRLALLFCAAIAAAQSAAEGITFDDVEYLPVSHSAVDGADLVELLTGNESVADWTTMLSIQHHPNATSVSEVVNPYLRARHRFMAVKPQIFASDASPYAEDVVIQLFLGGPGLTKHMEFALARFVNVDHEHVYAVVYSRRLPHAAPMDVDYEMRMRNQWISELLGVDVAMVEAQFRDRDRRAKTLGPIDEAPPPPAG